MAAIRSTDRSRSPQRQRKVTLLDYGAGNVQSVFNAIACLGYDVEYVNEPDDILKAERLVFPGVGAFGSCMDALRQKGYYEPLLKYLKDGRPYFGICLGMQTLFEGSEESPGVEGFGILPGVVKRFPRDLGLAVPNINWSGVAPMLENPWPLETPSPRCYFVHSYRVSMPESGYAPWALACSEYGERYVCAVRHAGIVATQFHPEKSGVAGLNLLNRWLQGGGPEGEAATARCSVEPSPAAPARRIIACLDVRSNDAGDLVVTKGDCYDVREGGGEVRNHGKPVALAERYYEEGADEVTFLNITAFREVVLADQPMLEVLRSAAERIFVPLTVGGGIRSYVDASGKNYSALEVADAYFRAGADKVSIGSDAVEAARAYYKRGKELTGETAIESISTKYGRQAVVVSVDPRRKYVADAASSGHNCVEIGTNGGNTPLGPNDERFVWYCCTVKGGREDSDMDVVQLAQAVEALGAGELLLNCIDRDGQNNGYELELIRQVKSACSLPVIASSGAGCPEHFTHALASPSASGGGADAALAAGIFHRREVPLAKVKAHLHEVANIPVRL
jgi:imidazole glycerol-phosphate synthase